MGRKHGLAASSVTAIELVTADGRFVRVDHEREPDLFWALPSRARHGKSV